MGTFIDLTGNKPKRYTTHICYYCNSDKYPKGKVIDPTTDKNWHKTSKGDYMCGFCSVERSLSLFGGKK